MGDQLANAQIQAFDIQQGINNKLTGAMIGDLSSPVGINDGNSANIEKMLALTV